MYAFWIHCTIVGSGADKGLSWYKYLVQQAFLENNLDNEKEKGCQNPSYKP